MVQRHGATPTLQALDVLVGEWAVRAGNAPVGEPEGGRVSFAWLKGGLVLVQQWTIDAPEFPDGIAVITEDAESGGFVQRYYDSRGVARAYGMSLRDGVWRLWRDDPDFAQRFTGEIAEDGRSIEGRWEIAPERTTYEHDFDLHYTRVS
jgi:hypothetical protein